MRKYFVFGLLLSLASAANGAQVLYYNDGTVDDFAERWGDTGVDVPWNLPFEPGGWLDGSPDDTPPANTNTNRGLVTLQGAAGGVAGGGFRRQVTVAGNTMGVILAPYGSAGSIKGAVGVNWEARFQEVAAGLGVSREEAIRIWRDQGVKIGNWAPSKLVAYTGDPLVMIPPGDISLTDLQSENWPAVSAYLAANPNVIPIFWENTGQRPLETLDILFGDFELNSGYANLRHHIPFFAVVGGVGPATFGINPANANMLRLNGDALGGSPTAPFTSQIGLAAFDPIMVVPEPSAVALVLLAGACCCCVSVRTAALRRKAQSA